MSNDVQGDYLQAKPELRLKLHPPITTVAAWPLLKSPEQLVGRYGTCNISRIALRAEPSDAAEMEGELVFGDLFSVLETSGSCLKIQRHFRTPACSEWGSMRGWIDNHLVPAMLVSEEEFERLLHVAVLGYVGVATARAESAAQSAPCLSLPFGSVLRDYFERKDPVTGKVSQHFIVAGTEYRISMPADAAIAAPLAPTIENLLRVLKEWDGTPYFWGGQTTWGVDCSGLTQTILRLFGVELPRNASEQLHVGEKVLPAAARTGNLAFWGMKTRPRPGHVGFVLRGEDGTLALCHAKQRVKLERAIQLDDGSFVYSQAPEGVELKAITAPLEFR